MISSARRTACRPSCCRRCRDPRPTNRRGRSSRPPLRLRWQPLRPPAVRRRSRHRGFPRPTRRPAFLGSAALSLLTPRPLKHVCDCPEGLRHHRACLRGGERCLEGREPRHRVHHAALRAGCGAGLRRGPRPRRAGGRACRRARSCGGPRLRGNSLGLRRRPGAGHRLGLRTLGSGSLLSWRQTGRRTSTPTSPAPSGSCWVVKYPSFLFVAMVIPSSAGPQAGRAEEQ